VPLFDGVPGEPAQPDRAPVRSNTAAATTILRIATSHITKPTDRALCLSHIGREVRRRRSDLSVGTGFAPGLAGVRSQTSRVSLVAAAIAGVGSFTASRQKEDRA
jgi:hypothetical protein